MARTIESPLGVAATMALFAVVCLGISGGLLALRHHTLSGIAEARHWQAVPCEILAGEFATSDGERWLDLQYRYEIDGRSYTGGTLDLMPGSMGDDVVWEEQLLARHPPGSTAECWVDPDDPQRSVLDREHGSHVSGRLLLMAFPFGFIGAGFAYALVGGFLRGIRERRPAPRAPRLGPPPRRIGALARIAFLLGAGSDVRLAWAFLVGFSLFFTIVEGPGHVSDLLADDSRHLRGTVTRVEAIDAVELGVRVVEIRFRFEVDGVEHTGVSHRPGGGVSVGDAVMVAYDPERPGTAHLVGARRRSTPVWLAAVPLAVVALLGVGICGAYAFRLRRLRLLTRGAVAGSVDDDRILVAGEEVEVDRRSPADPEDDAGVDVLYDPADPAHNLALGPAQRAVLAGGAAAWRTLLTGLLVPGVCLGAAIWLLFVVDPAL